MWERVVQWVILYRAVSSIFDALSWDRLGILSHTTLCNGLGVPSRFRWGNEASDNESHDEHNPRTSTTSSTVVLDSRVP
jgi:hypothetical protein